MKLHWTFRKTTIFLHICLYRAMARGAEHFKYIQRSLTQCFSWCELVSCG